MSGIQLPLWLCIVIGIIGVPVGLYQLGQLIVKAITFYRDYQEGCRFQEALEKYWDIKEEAERQALALEEGLNDVVIRLESFHISE